MPRNPIPDELIEVVRHDECARLIAAVDVNWVAHPRVLQKLCEAAWAAGAAWAAARADEQFADFADRLRGAL